jgi:glycosyltransferase involved in cell wall biosynthesis
MLFSFVSTVYNQENYIVSHLESIKFQILNYGREYDFELVLCDDCSTDKTLDYANQWLDNNRHLFKVVKILASETNEGIIKNYVKGLNSFEGDFFHSLGGDDLYSCANLFECVELLKEFDIVQGSILEFEEEKIKTGLEYRCFADFQSLNLKEVGQNARRGKFIFLAPGFLFKKELITKELLNYLLEFKMFEDRPLYYFLLKNDNIKIYYYQTPIVLYRMSASSISRNSSCPGNSDLIKDNVNFFSALLGEANTLFRSMYIRYCILWVQSSKLRFLYRFNPIMFFDKSNKIIRNIKYRTKLKAYREDLTHLVRKNETHILRCSGKLPPTGSSRTTRVKASFKIPLAIFLPLFSIIG